jgi:hypothetical protein
MHSEHACVDRVSFGEFDSQKTEFDPINGEFEAAIRRPSLHAFHMFGPENGAALIDAEGFEESIAVEKAAVENGDLGLRFR